MARRVRRSRIRSSLSAFPASWSATDWARAATKVLIGLVGWNIRPGGPNCGAAFPGPSGRKPGNPRSAAGLTSLPGGPNCEMTVGLWGRPAQAATEARPPGRLASHHAVELGQRLGRLFLDRGPEDGGEFIHLTLQAFGLEDRLAEFLQPGQVETFEFVHLVHALEKQDLSGPRLVDTQVLALLRSSNRIELAEGVVEVPGQELELALSWGAGRRGSSAPSPGCYPAC